MATRRAIRTQPAAQVPHDHFEAIVEFSDDAILSKDSQGLITSWNPAAERLYGYTPEEAVGQPISILIPPSRRGEEREILDRVLAGEQVDHYETERLTKDGRLLVVSLTVSPIADESGRITRASVIARDVTSRNRSLEMSSRLQSVTSLLSRDMSAQQAIDALLEQVSAGLDAGGGAVGLLTEAGDEIELVDSVGYSEEGVADFQRFPLDADLPMSWSIRENEAVWTSTARELAERFSLVDASAVTFPSLAVIPLAVGGRAFGAVSLSFKEEMGFDPEQKAFFSAAVQQAAHAIDRARLFESQRLAAERLSFLAEASEVLAESLDPDETLQRVSELVVRRIADWCGIDLVEEDGGLKSVAVAHVDPAQVAMARRLREEYPTDPESPIGAPNVIRTGVSELYSEIPDELLTKSAQDEKHLELIRSLGLASAMIVPLQARGRSLGALTLISSDPERRYDEADLEFAEDLARRAALAVDNANLYRREHEAALTLQRSLLPQSLPEVEELEFATHYSPAGLGLEAGGDWYEVVVHENGDVGLSIGDVAGRGIKAAAVMGRLRMSLRAYVLDGRSPAEAAERLDRLMKEAAEPEMVTLFHLRYRPQTGSAEYVRAGHPPALLKLPDGEVVELAGRGTPPLGILSEIEYIQHEVEIPAGSTLLVYTDGLIERRGDDLEHGLARLKQAFSEAPTNPEQCLDFLRDRFGADEIPDDVAMLAMHRRTEAQ